MSLSIIIFNHPAPTAKYNLWFQIVPWTTNTIINIIINMNTNPSFFTAKFVSLRTSGNQAKQ